jgi:sugar fermentation stimulation protein A
VIFESPLVVGRFLKRYQRFFADVELDGGEVVTAHVANTGSMMGIATPLAPAALMRSNNPARKLAYTLEMIQVGDAWVGVNTSRPNQVVEEAIRRSRIPELRGYAGLRREVKYGNGSRIDLLLSDEGQPTCYVEVKNVTLREGCMALFPDAVTSRGKKHLEELSEVARSGSRAVMMFLVNRGDCTSCGVADGIDPEYGECLRRVQQAGVELLAYQTELSLSGIDVVKRVPVNLDHRSTLRR